MPSALGPMPGEPLLSTELSQQVDMLVADHQETLERLLSVDFSTLLRDGFLAGGHQGRLSAALPDINTWKEAVFSPEGVVSGVLPTAIAYWQQRSTPDPLSARVRLLIGALWPPDALIKLADYSDIFEVPVRPRFLEKLLDRREPTRTRSQGLTCESDPRYLALLSCAVLATTGLPPAHIPQLAGYPTHPAWITMALGVVCVHLEQIRALQLQLKRRQYERASPGRPLEDAYDTAAALRARYTRLLDTSCVSASSSDPATQVAVTATRRTLESVGELLLQQAVHLSLSAERLPALTPAVPATLARSADAPPSALRAHLCATLMAMSQTLQADAQPPHSAPAILGTLLLNLAAAVSMCAPDKPPRLSDYQTLITEYL